LPITRRNVMRHELIGLEARVVDSTDPGLLGVEGRIIDETRGTLVIEHLGKPKVIHKAAVTLRITLPSGEGVEVEGEKLVAKPEERVRLKWR